MSPATSATSCPAWTGAGTAVVTHPSTEVQIPAQTATVRIDGWLGRKLDLCLTNRVMAQDLERLLIPFRERREADYGGFRCEYWGKWFTSAVLGYAYQPTPEHRAIIDEAARGLIATQNGDGYIGTYAADKQLEGWDIWGRKYVLLGLIAYYDQTGDERALEAACRAADHLMGQVGPGKANIADLGYPGWQGLPPSSILEPIVLLYQRTGRPDYLAFARWIVEQWERPSALAPEGMRLISDVLLGKSPDRIAAPKAYEMMSCFEGLCELYRATGDSQYLDVAIRLGESIRQHERMVVGSGSNLELWCEGARCQTEMLEQPMETCVSVTWSKLCFQLLRLTGDSKWADELELTLYNALLGAMTPQGEWWAYYSQLFGQRVPSHAQHPDVGLSCCVANGPRALLLAPRWAVTGSAEGPVVNLYAPGIADVRLADGTAVRIVQETDYPEGDLIRVRLEPEHPVPFTLSLRIPAWSKLTRLSVCGEPVECQPGAYARLTRQWSAGDVVELRLDLRGRAVAAPSGAPALAVMRGPIVLALDSRLAAPDDVAVRLKADADGFVALEPAAEKPAEIWMAFAVPFETRPSHAERRPASLTMCDYASAGNGWNARNLLRVWLPQPLFLRQMFIADGWKLIYPYPEYPGCPSIPVPPRNEKSRS